MRDEDISKSSSGSDEFPNERDDAQWQRAILAVLLAECPYRASSPYRGSCPHQLSELELARELLGENPGSAERAAFERAVEVLISVGLLQRCQAMIFVTLAARHFDSLEL